VSHGTQVLTPQRRTPFVYGALTLFGRASQHVPLNVRFVKLRGLPCRNPESALQPPCRNSASLSHDTGLGSSHFARRYYGNLSCFLFLQVLRWFSSLGFAFVHYFIYVRMTGISPAGLPHSVTPGSRDVCSSPGLFAAYHDLPRQIAPRHPP
jgi:hypothetical protein